MLRAIPLGGLGEIGLNMMAIGYNDIIFIKERRALSEGELVVFTMIIDEETGVVLYGPELVSKGFVFDSATGYTGGRCAMRYPGDRGRNRRGDCVPCGINSQKISKGIETVFCICHKPKAADCADYR